LFKRIAFQANLIDHVEDIRRATKILRLVDLNPTFLNRDRANPRGIDLLHRISKKSKAESLFPLFPHQLEHFNHLLKRILALVHEHKWEALRDQSTQQRLCTQLLRHHLDDIVMPEDSLSIV